MPRGRGRARGLAAVARAGEVVVALLVVLGVVVGGGDSGGKGGAGWAALASTACAYEWQVAASLVPVFSAEESVKETVARSKGKGKRVFNGKAVMRLTWMLARRVGQPARRVVDARATSQAFGLGILPEVTVASQFWDDEMGDQTLTLEEMFGAGLTPPRRGEPGWKLDLKINAHAAFRPLVIRTTSQWEDVSGKFFVCPTSVVLRSPMLELLNLDDEQPFVRLGSSQHGPSFLAQNADVDEMPYGLEDSWESLDISGGDGLSWLQVAIAHSGLKGHNTTLWVSTNSFQNLEDINRLPLDLDKVYPFETPREHVNFDWDLDGFASDIYEEVPEEDTYFDGVVETSFDWNAGPCVSALGSWTPQLISFGRVLVASTSWGIASRTANRVNLYEEEINKGWQALAPLCGKIVAPRQMDPLDVGSACSFLFIPDAANRTTTAANETFDATRFQDIELPTLFAARGDASTCMHVSAASRTTANEAQTNEKQKQGKKGLPGFKPTKDSTSQVDRDTDGQTGATSFELEEVVDDAGQSLARAFNLSEEDARILSVSSLLLNRPGSVLVLLEVNQVYKVVQLVDHSWSELFTFPSEVAPNQFSETHEPMGPVGDAEAGQPVVLKGMTEARELVKSVYVFGNLLLMSADGGASFRKVGQGIHGHGSPFSVNSTEHDHMLFHNDPIEQVVTSADGWLAVLSQSSRVWVGRVGADSVALLTASLELLMGLKGPISLFFDEVGELHAAGFRSAGEHGNLRTLASAVALDLESVKLATVRPHVETKEPCPLETVVVLATMPASLTRKLQKTEGFEKEDQVVQQDSSFFNELPPRVFLDRGENYSFKVQLFMSESARDRATELNTLNAAMESLRIGFASTNQRFVEFSHTRKVNMLERKVEYTVLLRDTGKWAPQENPVAPGVGLPGKDLAISELRLAGLSPHCLNKLGPNNIVSTSKSEPPLSLKVYSGCPPLQRIEFAPVQSQGLRSHGCNVDQEDICVFYHYSFDPLFLMIDQVTGREQLVGASVGDIQVIGGGLTFETIEDFPEEDRALKTNLTLSMTNGDTIRWVCLVKGSPCYQVPPNFPSAPQVYLKLQLRSSPEGSYCDLRTTFVVRVHNLPITIETILATNLVTITIFVIPLIILYRRDQRKNKQGKNIEDVDVAVFAKEKNHGLSDSDSEFGSEDSDSPSSD